MSIQSASPVDGRPGDGADDQQHANGRVSAIQNALREADEWLRAEAERERCLHLPSRVFGECDGAHELRGGPRWTDLPDDPPLGEEEARAIEVINWWLKDSQPTFD